MNSGRILMGVYAILVSAALMLPSAAATYHVDVNYDGANGDPNGSTTRPYTNILAAMAVHNAGDTIKIAKGEYKSVLAGGYEDFGATGYLLKGDNNTTYFVGGYVGQIAGDTFDWATRALPDAEAINPATMTVINLTNANARAFYGSPWYKTSSFNGLVFRDSNVTQSTYRGGALYVEAAYARAEILNCVFINNRTTGSGGAVWLRGRGTVSRNCVFIGNHSNANGGAAKISGVNGEYTIEDFVFLNNTAGSSGGALYRKSGSNENGGGTLRDVLFEGNQAGVSGGGYSRPGNSSSLIRCRFIDNTAPADAAVGNHVIDLLNCLMVGNTATGASGYVVRGSTLTLRHVTFAGNTIATGGAAVYGSSATTVRNGIIAGRGVGTGISAAGTATLEYNNVVAFATLYGGVAAPGTGSISADPRFMGADNYRLRRLSPCRNSGDDIGVTDDLDGNSRPLDSWFDMGCYENEPIPPPFSLFVVR